MPSWNIHTAHAERLIAEHLCSDLGIADANAFLFGNYVPDIYVGFMVPDVTYRIDYCLTHLTTVVDIPEPDADLFWDNYIYKRTPSSPEGLSLTLGAWAHLVADREYNCRFREFCAARGISASEDLRMRKQGDFDTFGRTLGISACVHVTPGLTEAARMFKGYSIVEDDVARSVDVASAIVHANAQEPGALHYRLLTSEWFENVFDSCHASIASWLEAWVRMRSDGASVSAENIRQEFKHNPASFRRE